MKCFISREYNISSNILYSIQEVLDELGIQYFDMYSKDSDIDIALGVINIISNAQIVIGVLTPNANNVLFEIGLAVGRGKEVFLLIDDSIDVPTDIYGMSYIKINNNLKENLTLPLSFFIDKKRKRQQVDYTKYYLKRGGFENNFKLKERYIERLENIKKNRDSIEYENLVADLFEEIKEQYATLKHQPTTKDEAYDFAVWIDELSGKIMNPVKFELKVGDFSVGKINDFVDRMAMKVKKQELVIILYCGREINYQNKCPNILVIKFEDFLDKLEKYNLAHTIWYFRCLGAHGRSFDNDSI